MSNGWSSKDVGIPGTYGASLTNAPISREYPITASGSRACAIKLVASAFTAGAGISLKLQTACGSDWVDVKSVSVSGTGATYLRLLDVVSADQSVLPLLLKGRLVITTGAGSSITVDTIEVVQGQ
jgi:hypothetical protein